MDVDGTLTDGVLTLTPEGGEWKSFHVRDGAGVKLLPRVGITPAIVSGRTSEAVSRRAREMGVTLVHQGVDDKAARLRELCAQLGLRPEEAAFAGDDLSDVPAMRLAGFSAAPADAAPEAQAVADYVTPSPGGHGAVREAIEVLLKRLGRWEEALAAPDAARDGTPA
jgi:3-deoxy-D-manno-octulosonate 8-phosphate phosphatase (KDO 8-P phosphatase)